ncbi:hypothetical protein AVEN_181251-1 [Araneus ventricosus]|uniref:Uncharacterized protein n=1 Tax=Araneus ventricosus TaxID=182803 RepID=A0A4Y2WI23_ARAVE|nr:hypothetical protein AVEN_181251-1 [Araneus ventricosus]
MIPAPPLLFPNFCTPSVGIEMEKLREGLSNIPSTYVVINLVVIRYLFFQERKAKYLKVTMVKARLRDRKIAGSTPNSTSDSPCMWAWCTLNLQSRVKIFISMWRVNLEIRLPAQVSSS